MKTKYLLVTIVLFMAVPSCQRLSLLPGEEILFEEDFNKYADGSRLPSGWWCEGSKAVRIEKGHLQADANPDGSGEPRPSLGAGRGEDYEACTVWLNKEFSGNIRVEFDAHVLASEGDKNNINFFLFFSDPSGKSLYDTKDERADGKYGKYHKLNGYVFTFLANGNPQKARFRMRDDPGFGLLKENYAYECRQSKTYHVTIEKNSNRITYEVDGTVYLDAVDNTANPEHTAGIIGFRTWRTEMWWDNLRVIRLQECGRRGAQPGRIFK